jgi:hypothetical protein
MPKVVNHLHKNPTTELIIRRTLDKMRRWGITVTYLARQLGVSRQYAWQVIYYSTFVSKEKAVGFETRVDAIISQERHLQTYGDRLRAARISAGFTLKQVAERLGYTWVGVERWEKNVCLPKPSVLLHLRTLYGVDDQWRRPDAPVPAPATHEPPWTGSHDRRKVA